MTGDSGRAEWLRRARAYLRDADPVLARLIEDRPDFDPQAWLAQLPPMDLFGALLFQVTGQQLSVAATRRTLARIQDLFGGRLPAPAELLAADPATLRAAGLSWRKVAHAARAGRAAGRRPAGTKTPWPRCPTTRSSPSSPPSRGSAPGPPRAPCCWRSAAKTSCCPATWPCARPSAPPTTSTTSPPSKKSSPSPPPGGPTAAWPPATCSPPPSPPPNRPAHHHPPHPRPNALNARTHSRKVPGPR